MNRYLPDTPCLIALLCDWHEHHQPTLRDMERRRTAGDRLVLAAPALVEAYSVLTRLPAPFRLTEQDAMNLLEANWRKAETVSLGPQEYWKTLQAAAVQGIGGGQIYDAVIAACARKARAKAILTWNAVHFLPFQSRDLAVLTPAMR